MNRCDYFKAMFNAGMKEQIGGRVTIEETTPEAFQAILLYLYTGNPDVVSEEVVLDLLRLADQYLVGDLYRYCVNFMERHLCKSNAVEWFLFSDSRPNSRDGLRELCKKYLVENYKAIQEEFPETIDTIPTKALMRELLNAAISVERNRAVGV
jgi:hypothetical protein